MSRRRPNRRVAVVVAAAVVTVALVIGLLQSDPVRVSTDAGPTDAQLQSALGDAPPVLRALYADGDHVLTPDAAGFEALVASLAGYPVVINKWGSWCGPCRDEFPVFRRALAAHGDRVAFLGLNVEDEPAKRAAFLRGTPAGYPHVQDANQALATRLDARGGAPKTIFLNGRGELVHVKAGPYVRLQDLEADLRRYAADDARGARWMTGGGAG